MDLYLLLYLPLAGLTVLWLLAAVKIARNYRVHSRGTLLKIVGAELAVALFIASFAVMVVTHAHGFKIAMMLVMAMALVNFLRLMVPKHFDTQEVGAFGD